MKKRLLLVAALFAAHATPVHAEQWWTVGSWDQKPCVSGAEAPKYNGASPAEAFQIVQARIKEAAESREPRAATSVFEDMAHAQPLLLDKGDVVLVGWRGWEDNVVANFYRTEAACLKAYDEAGKTLEEILAPARKEYQEEHPSLGKYQ